MSSCSVLVVKIPEYKFVAEVVSYDDATQTATIRQRNVINEGDQVEFYGPGFRHFETYIEDLHDAKGNKIDRAPNPMELLTIKFHNQYKQVIWSVLWKKAWSIFTKKMEQASQFVHR